MSTQASMGCVAVLSAMPRTIFLCCVSTSIPSRFAIGHGRLEGVRQAVQEGRHVGEVDREALRDLPRVHRDQSPGSAEVARIRPAVLPGRHHGPAVVAPDFLVTHPTRLQRSASPRHGQLRFMASAVVL
jgi:hypothetical protein